MIYITPSTHDLTKDSSQWRLEPSEKESYQLQAVEMTFDSDIKQTSDIIVRFWNYNLTEPVKEVRYSSFLDWIRKSTSHTKIDGVYDKDIHKFYMNFSQDIFLYHKDLDATKAHYMTIDIEDGEVLKDSNGNECAIAIGEYIINVTNHG